MDPDSPQPASPIEVPPAEAHIAPNPVQTPDQILPSNQPVAIPAGEDISSAKIPTTSPPEFTSEDTIPVAPTDYDSSPEIAPIGELPVPIAEQAVPPANNIAVPEIPQAPIAQPQPQIQTASTLSSPTSQSPIIPGQVTPEMASLFQSWLAAYQRKLGSLGTLGLKRKKQKHLDRVVELAGERGSVTRRELQLAMRLSEATIGKYTHELVALGRLRHVGAPSHGRYERV